jgi:hypothetical protein
LCGEFLKEYLIRRFNSQSEIIRVKGLQVDCCSTFQSEGIKGLGKVIRDELNNLKGQEVILNLTGGFKATIPYLSLFGMLYNLPIYYIFEEKDELIEIPPVPVKYNVETIKTLIEYFIKIEVNTSIKATILEPVLSNENKIFFQKEGNEYTTSFFGDMFWNKYKEDLEPDEKNLPETKLQPNEKAINFGSIPHDGKKSLEKISKKLILSPYVEEVIDSCDYESGRKQQKVIPLTSEEYRKHKTIPREGVCIVIDDKSDKGYAMLVQTTGRIFWETKKIAEILKGYY